MKDKIKNKMKGDYEPTLVEIISEMGRGVAKRDTVQAINGFVRGQLAPYMIPTAAR